MKKIIHTVAVLSSLSLGGFLLAQAPATSPAAQSPAAALDDASRVKAWREDIDFLVAELPKRHKNAFFATPREQFESAAADLSGEVPALTDAQIVIHLSGLAAMLGDGHTSIALDYNKWNLRPYPVFMRSCSDGMFIMQAASTHAQLLGAQVLAIDDVPMDEIIDRLSKVISHDNQWALKNALVNWLCLAEALNAIGVVKDMDHAQFLIRDAQGVERTVELAPLGVTLAQARTVPMKFLPNLPADKLPISYQRKNVSYWMELLPDAAATPGGGLYVRYDRCADDKDKTVKQFAEEVLAAINDQNVQTVVIDLRRNGGGNSALLRPLVQGLADWKKAKPDARLAVLIGRNTFSSAVMNAVELRRDAGAILVGEPSGGKPNHFGEVRTFELPNSRVIVQYSTKYFKMQDEDTPGVMPDLSVELTSTQFINAEDPVLQAALKP